MLLIAISNFASLEVRFSKTVGICKVRSSVLNRVLKASAMRATMSVSAFTVLDAEHPNIKIKF